MNRRPTRCQTVGMRTPLFALVALLLVAGCADGDGDAGDDAPTSTTDRTSVSTVIDSSSIPVPETSDVSTPVTTTPTTPPVTTPPVTVPATTVPSTTAPATTAQAPVRPTIDELLAREDVLNIAHAGGDQIWPHSTFYAFDRAVEAGADVLEMDVQLTGDGVLIVQHDDTVDGTTNGTGRVDSYTFEEITALDAAHWYAPGCWPCRDLPAEEYVLRGVRTGEVPAPEGVDPETLRIVSFAELVERYPDMPLDVEIKGTGEAAAAAARVLAAEIDELGVTGHVVVVSFDDATVELFRSLAPDVDVSPGVGEMSAWLLEGAELASGTRIVQVPPMFGDVQVITPEFWSAVELAGVEVWVWPNDAASQENTEFYTELVTQGADGIIAGRPDLLPAAD